MKYRCVPIDEHCEVDGLHCCKRRECICDGFGSNCKCIEIHRTKPEFIGTKKEREVENHTEKPKPIDKEKPDFFERGMKYLTLLERLNNITISFAKQMMYG